MNLLSSIFWPSDPVARGSLLVPHEDINAALRVLYTTAAMGKTGSCELAPPA